MRQIAIFLLLSLAAACVKSEEVYGPELEGFDYPWPEFRFHFTSQRQSVHMAYLELKPDKPNGRTAVLLHGKNFCSATWEGTMRFLQQQGYRVIAPDQIGFCKSSRPAAYQYSFHQLAHNTKALLDSLGIGKVTVIGHSTGGMLATAVLAHGEWHGVFTLGAVASAMLLIVALALLPETPAFILQRARGHCHWAFHRWHAGYAFCTDVWRPGRAAGDG